MRPQRRALRIAEFVGEVGGLIVLAKLARPIYRLLCPAPRAARPPRRAGSVVRTTSLRLLSLALLCSGCATGDTVAAADWPSLYTKPGRTHEQLIADGTGCHWSAKGPKVDAATAFLVGGWLGLTGGVPTAESHAACMREKGYSAWTPIR